jgi:trimeric autotransporter adhesin
MSNVSVIVEDGNNVNLIVDNSNDVVVVVDRSAVGATGPQGPAGPSGAAATVAVGTTTTGAAGTSAAVNNSGTSSAAVLNFTIPRGDTGAPGAGVATGGTAGQVLVKNSSTNYDTVWQSVATSGVSAVTGTAPVVSSGGTTPAISMAASNASTNGYLTATDWNTFNNKGSGTVTSVTATSPVVSTGGATPQISIPAATTSANGYLTSADWNTFNGKQPAGSYLTAVTVDSPLAGAGTSASHLSIPAATSSVNGYLTSTDWTTFNSKGSGTVTSVGGTGTVNGISLSGTVTSTGSLTLGGTLDLSSPPAIGGTAPAAGSFTTLIGGAGSANYEQITGGATTKAVQFQTLGTDTNVALAIQSKGTGAIDLAAGSSGVNISNGGTVTAITRTAGGTGYTVAPTVNISAPTTAGGTQATATCTVTAGVVDTAFTITNAGSGYVEQPTITFTPVSGGSGAAAYATVGGVTTIKSLGSGTTSVTLSSLQFYTPNTVAPALTLRDIGGADTGLLISPAIGYINLVPIGAANATMMLASGGTNSIYFNTQGTSQINQMRVAHTASAVNYVQVTGGAAGNPPVISAQGATTPDLDLTLTPKGAGRVNITTSIKPKVNSAANVTSPLAWNSTSYDEYAITALANALTINADANASPADGQKMMFRFKDNGTARALTWTTGSTNSFRAVGITLPTTTVASKIVYIGCVYNAADSRWDAVAVSQEA